MVSTQNNPIFAIALVVFALLGSSCPDSNLPVSLDLVSSIWKELAQGRTLSGPQMQNLYVADNKRLKPLNAQIPAHLNQADGTLRIATYNVHFWTDSFVKANFDNILAVIKSVNADILILQEVNWGPTEFNGKRSQQQLENAFRQLGYAYGGTNTFCEDSNFRGAPFGNVIFSKVNLEPDIVLEKYGSAVGAGRCFVKVRVPLSNGKILSVYGTHLDVGTEANRMIQITKLYETYLAKDTSDHMVLGGDFNAVSQKHYQYEVAGKLVWDLLVQRNAKLLGQSTPTQVLDYLDARLVDVFALSNLPRFTVWTGTVVDYLYQNPAKSLAVAGAYVFASSVSDHRPVMVDFRL